MHLQKMLGIVEHVGMKSPSSVFTLAKSLNDAPATKADIHSFDISYNYGAQWL